MIAWRLKDFLPHIFAKGVTIFLFRQDCKIKYGKESSISNVDLGLFQPHNQLMFSFIRLNYSNNVYNYEFSTSVILKHLEHFGIIRVFSLPGGTC